MKGDKKFEAWAGAWCKNVIPLLLVEDFYPVKLVYVKKLSDNAYMQIGTSYPYKSIKIFYSDAVVEDWKKKDFDELKNSLVHELCHPITDPLYVKATYRYVTKDDLHEERERLTDHIANILLKCGHPSLQKKIAVQ